MCAVARILKAGREEIISYYLGEYVGRQKKRPPVKTTDRLAWKRVVGTKTDALSMRERLETIIPEAWSTLDPAGHGHQVKLCWRRNDQEGCRMEVPTFDLARGGFCDSTRLTGGTCFVTRSGLAGVVVGAIPCTYKLLVKEDAPLSPILSSLEVRIRPLRERIAVRAWRHPVCSPPWFRRGPSRRS